MRINRKTVDSERVASPREALPCPPSGPTRPLGIKNVHRSRCPRALTLVEILVVLVIIGVLASAIMVASSSVLDRARINSTRAVLQVVFDAVEEFKREQEARPTLTRTTVQVPGVGTYRYVDRYGAYPPDELEVFTQWGLPGQPPPGNVNRSLAPSRAYIGPRIISPLPTGWGAMRFYRENNPQPVLEHRDLAALIVAIETLGDTSKAILDRIPDRNRTPGPLANGRPAIFLDRPARPGASGGEGEPDDNFGPEDLQIRYIVDDWGVPISYFAQRDHRPGEEIARTNRLESSNHHFWRQASSWFVRANRGLPVVMSYGPTGKDQLKQEAMGETAAASLVGDYADNDLDRKINHPLNADNIYINPELKERLAEGPRE